MGHENMKWMIIVGIVAIVIVALALARHFSSAKAQEVADDWPPEVKAQVAASQAHRTELRAQYPKLFVDVQQCLFRHDPVGINFETNADEYDPEVGTIIPRLPNCKSQDDVLNVVHEEFVQWFGADVAGPITKYEAISEDIWKMWKTRETQPDIGQVSSEAAPSASPDEPSM